MNDIQSINLVNAIRRIARQDVSNNMIFGKVVSVDPLRIDIGNGVVLTKKFLYLGQMCRPFKVTIPHTHKYSGETENSTATAGTPSADIPDDFPIDASSPMPTSSGDLTITGQAVAVEVMGHGHKINNQETDDVHKNGCGTEYEKSVTIDIYPKLKKDDIVLMFAMNSNQMYYVAERVESK